MAPQHKQHHGRGRGAAALHSGRPAGADGPRAGGADAGRPRGPEAEADTRDKGARGGAEPCEGERGQEAPGLKVLGTAANAPEEARALRVLAQDILLLNYRSAKRTVKVIRKVNRECS